MDGFCPGYTGKIEVWESARRASSNPQELKRQKIIDQHLENDKLNGMWGSVRGNLSGVKRIRVTCPVCGRKLILSVQVAPDADGIIHSIPKHKPKGYNKQKKFPARKSSYAR